MNRAPFYYRVAETSDNEGPKVYYVIKVYVEPEDYGEAESGEYDVRIVDSFKHKDEAAECAYEYNNMVARRLDGVDNG